MELPLAVPTIMTGVRTAAINIIATATIAPLAGVLTLGDYIINPNVYGDEGVLAGAILVALLALAVELVLAGVQRLLTPRGLALQRAPRAERIGFPRPRGLGEMSAERERRTLDEHQVSGCERCSRCSPSQSVGRHRRLRR